MNDWCDPKDGCREMRDEAAFGSNGCNPGEVQAAIDLLREALIAERSCTQAAAAHATEIKSFETITVRVRALFELERQVQSLQAAYAALSLDQPPVNMRVRASDARLAPSQPPVSQSLGVERRGTLAELALLNVRTSEVTGSKPTHVRFPDETSEEVLSWKDLTGAVVTWLSNRYELPLPFAGRRGGTKWFVNSEPRHADGGAFDHVGRRRIPAGRGDLWVDTRRSAGELLRCLERLVIACGQSPGAFEVTYRQRHVAQESQKTVARSRANADAPAHGPETYAEPILAALRENPAGLALRDLWAQLEPRVADWMNAADRVWMPKHSKARWQYASQWSLTILKHQGLVGNPKRGFWVLVPSTQPRGAEPATSVTLPLEK